MSIKLLKKQLKNNNLKFLIYVNIFILTDIITKFKDAALEGKIDEKGKSWQKIKMGKPLRETRGPMVWWKVAFM